MKAEKGTFINKNRVNLGERIPLDTPFAVFMDVCSACNFRCGFCAPQNNRDNLYFSLGSMSFEMAQKIVDDLKTFPQKIKILRLCNLGEPLLNREIPQIIKYIKDNDVTEKIEVVTNGTLLTHELSDALIASGLDMIRFSVEALTSQEYKKITGVEINIDELISNIRYFYEHKQGIMMYIKIANISVSTPEKKELFYQLFGDICDKIFIENITPGWPEYENEIIPSVMEKTMYGDKISKTKLCSHMFYTMVIDKNGIVSLCEADWNKKLKIGNISENSLFDIWHSDIAKKHWINMLTNGRAGGIVCKNCKNCDYSPSDNIDSYADEILSRME